MTLPGRKYVNQEGRFQGIQGMEVDRATGYTAFQLRNYDPRIGRWLSADPYRQHWSPYVALGNNPIMRIDPDGGSDIAAIIFMLTLLPPPEEGDTRILEGNNGNFVSPGLHIMSGTDGTGIAIWASTDLAYKFQVYTGKEYGWQTLAFETEDGTQYTWDVDKNYYVNENGEEFDDHFFTVDLINMAAETAKAPAQMFIDHVEKGDALASMKVALKEHGGSLSEFVFDGFKQMASDIVSGGHKGMMAIGSLYMGFLSGGGMLSTANTAIPMVSRTSLVSSRFSSYCAKSSLGISKMIDNFGVGKSTANGVSQGTNTVYRGLDAAGNVRYVGITLRAPAVRFAEHLGSNTNKSLLRFEAIPGASNLSRIEAKVWEQGLINKYGLQKNGGQLFNRINSISPKKWQLHGIK